MSERWICLDCETTGLDPNKDEIVSLSIVNQDGEILFDELVKPIGTTYFPRATAIHGISWHTVKAKPFLREFRDKLMRIIMDYNTIVGYNISFDMDFIYNFFNCNLSNKLVDVMTMYSDYKKVPNHFNDGYKFFKLEECASSLGYKTNNKFHNSLEDVKATIYCYNKLKGMM